MRTLKITIILFYAAFFRNNIIALLQIVFIVFLQFFRTVHSIHLRESDEFIIDTSGYNGQFIEGCQVRLSLKLLAAMVNSLKDAR